MIMTFLINDCRQWKQSENENLLTQDHKLKTKSAKRGVDRRSPKNLRTTSTGNRKTETIVAMGSVRIMIALYMTAVSGPATGTNDGSIMIKIPIRNSCRMVNDALNALTKSVMGILKIDE